MNRCRCWPTSAGANPSTAKALLWRWRSCSSFVRTSRGDRQRRCFQDTVGGRLGLRHWERVGRAGDLERAACAGALGHEALELRRDDAVVLADEEPGRQLAPE